MSIFDPDPNPPRRLDRPRDWPSGLSWNVPVSSTTTVTTREVPLPCAVCEGKGYRPDVPDEPDGEWKQCNACMGKGWLMVTETVTTREVKP